MGELLGLLLLVVVFLVLYLVSRPDEPRMHSRAPQVLNGKQDRAGEYIKRYKPRQNLNRLVNRIVGGEVYAFPNQSAMLMQLVKFPDVSFYQAVIDFARMASKAQAVIIRAGQNLWLDPMFRENWAKSKAAGLLRGVYWFYDDRADPGRQAKLLVELLQGEQPELEIFIDWENSYGGGFGGIRNVVAMMQAVERALPGARVGLYTGYYWFVERTNAIANWAQYEYLAKRPLWLAYYAPASAVRIPAPWTEKTLMHWQYGTPVEDYGQKTVEIDMNYFNGTQDEFDNRYRGTELPEPQGETSMSQWYRVNTDTLNIRKGPGASYQDIGDLSKGQLIEVVEQPLGSWLRIHKIMDGGRVLDLPDPVSWCSSAYCVKIDPPVVTPPPAPDPITPPAYVIAHWVDGTTKKYVPE